MSGATDATAASATSARFRADSCVIDLDTRELHRDGERVEVESKVFDLMAILLRNRHRALSKRELGDTLWPQRAVTDAALSQLLRKARRALGDDGASQRFIRTVHGHGLQWVAALEIVEHPPDVPVGAAQAAGVVEAAPAGIVPNRIRKLALAGLAVLSAVLLGVAVWWFLRPGVVPQAQAAPTKIVLLPTLDRSGEADLAWTRRGLAGLMSSLLQDRAGTEVAGVPDASGSGLVEQPVGKDRLDASMRALGASHVVASELRKLGPLYEFEYVLRSVDDGRETSDVVRGDSPARLAVEAAVRLPGKLRHAGNEGSAGAAAAGIADPFVAEVYARGLDALQRGDYRAATKYFDICLDHDPNLPWPRLQLATAQVAAGDFEQAAENARRVADAAGQEQHFVLRAQALLQLASLASRRGDLDAAAGFIESAMAGLPAQGQLPLRIELMVASASIASERGQRAAARRTFNAALALARRTGDRRSEASALVNLAVVDNAEGDIATAVADLRDALDAARTAADGALELAILLNLGGAEFNAGHPLAAAALLRQSLALAGQRGDRRVQVLSAVMLSWVLAAFDHVDAAAALASAVLALGEAEDNRYWQAEAHWALSGVAARRERWPEALSELDQARPLYAELGLRQNLGQVLADRVQMLVGAGDRPGAELAAKACRNEAAADPANVELQARLPVIDAQLRHLAGEQEAAVEALSTFLASRGTDRGPATLAAQLQLGRWQMRQGAAESLLAEPAWTGWLNDLPEAIALRIGALRAVGRNGDAAIEQARLDRMRASGVLTLAPGLLQLR